jgi:predicted dinucleotide-binding enzyme
MSYVIIGTGTVGRTLASFFSNARIGEVGVRQRPNANAWLARGASAPRPIRGSFLFIREVGPELRQT